MVRAGCSDTPGTIFLFFFSLLFHENEIYGEDQEDDSNEMVPLQRFAFEEYRNDHSEYEAWDDLLYYFELYEGERAAVDLGADPVCRYQERVFEQGDAPAYKYYKYYWGVWGYDLHIL